MNQFLIVLALVGTALTMPIPDNSDAHPVNPLVIADESSVVKPEDMTAAIISTESSGIETTLSIEVSSEGVKLLDKNKEIVQNKRDETNVAEIKKEEKLIEVEKIEKTAEVSPNEEVEYKQEDKRDVTASENEHIAFSKPATNSGQLSDIESQLQILERIKFASSVQPVAVEEPLALPTQEADNSAETLPIAQSVVRPKNKTLDLISVDLNKEAARVSQNVEANAAAEADNLKQIKVFKIVDVESEVLPKGNEERNQEHIVAQKVTSDENTVENKQEGKSDAVVKQEERKVEPIEPVTTVDQQRVVRETEQSEEKSESKADEKFIEKEEIKRDKNVSADSSSQESRQEKGKAQEESKEENNKSMESESAEKLESIVQEASVEKQEDTIVVENKKNDSSSSSSESS